MDRSTIIPKTSLERQRIEQKGAWDKAFRFPWPQGSGGTSGTGLKLFKVVSAGAANGTYTCYEQTLSVPGSGATSVANANTTDITVVNFEEIANATNALVAGDLLFALKLGDNWVAVTRYAKTKS